MQHRFARKLAAGGRRGPMAAAGVLALLSLTACSGRSSTLTPAGPRAEMALSLHWIMFGMSAAVLALVLGLLAWALVRRGRPEDARQGGVAIVVLGGIVLPLAMLPVVWAITIGSMAEQQRPDEEVVATYEIVARRWAYEVRCPDGEVATNRLTIPVGQPVRLLLTSDDVIHSFWAPRLAGKQDMVPGTTNELWIQASEPGEFLVQCAEFCGEGHAHHAMTIVAGDAGGCGPGPSPAACCG